MGENKEEETSSSLVTGNISHIKKVLGFSLILERATSSKSDATTKWECDRSKYDAVDNFVYDSIHGNQFGYSTYHS